MQVKDELAGKRIKCPACGRTFTVSPTEAAAPPEPEKPAPDVLSAVPTVPAAPGKQHMPPSADPARAPAKGWPVKRYLLIGCGLLTTTFLLCCGGIFYFGHTLVQAQKMEIVKGNELWAGGNKGDAVARYKPILLQKMHVVEQAERPILFQRVIEFDLEQGDATSAKKLVEKALENDVALSLESVQGKELLARVQTEQEVKKVRAGKSDDQVIVVLTAPQLFGAFETNEAVANEKYKEKELEVTGKVVDIGSRIYVALNGGGLRKHVRCYFRADRTGQIDDVKDGQTVKLRGRCKGMVLGKVILDECSLVPN